jgi:hypothetical protein
MASMAASGEPAAAISRDMSGGLAVLISCEGLEPWPGGSRCCEALDENEDAAESMEGLRTGGVGLDSGMATGDAGGDMAAVDSVGDEACRS